MSMTLLLSLGELAHARVERSDFSHDSASDSSTPIAPYWAKDDQLGLSTHRSGLESYEPESPTALRDWIMEGKIAHRLSDQWRELNRAYEERKKYDLVSIEEEKEQISRIKDFTRNVISEIRNHHVRQNLRKARENAEKDENLKSLAKTFGWAAALVGFYQGEPLDLKISEESKITARINSESKRGAVSLASPMIHSGFDFLAGAPKTQENEEKYNVSAARGLGFFDLSSGVSYAGTSQKMTAFLSRPLLPYLTGTIDASRKVNPDNRYGTPAQASFKLLYSLNF